MKCSKSSRIEVIQSRTQIFTVLVALLFCADLKAEDSKTPLYSCMSKDGDIRVELYETPDQFTPEKFAEISGTGLTIDKPVKIKSMGGAARVGQPEAYCDKAERDLFQLIIYTSELVGDSAPAKLYFNDPSGLVKLDKTQFSCQEQ